MKKLMGEAGFVDIGEKVAQVSLLKGRTFDIKLLRPESDTTRTMGEGTEEQRDRYLPERPCLRLCGDSAQVYPMLKRETDTNLAKDSYTPALFTRVLGWSMEETEVFMAKCKEEIRNPKNQ